MSLRILSGRPFAEAIQAEVAAEVAAIKARGGPVPCLAVVRVGEDPASAVYVGSKVRTTEELGMLSEHLHFDENVSQQQVVKAVTQLNERDDVDGILVQLPLPKHLNEREILELIDPEKDVDGFHPVNTGHLMQGYDSLVPCTPAGVIELLKRSGVEIAGKHAVVVGRSNIVGKPMSMLLLQENATVTICHSRTKDLPAVTRSADILVAAMGRAGFITAEHIGDGATVIDVGINKLTDASQARELFPPEIADKRVSSIGEKGSTLIGDVDQKAAYQKAGAFTPVPGGVGLLTVAMLMKNTVKAAKMRRAI
ncbi:MAG: bifunctional methylenetetrahydrofolate dehydrogenase/methenyltetrahydrofolate cyclohydrolase FolD [Acidobacteria bacterium]|nr:bifunctional methylenetetrahydrofolate dehydrogenase/methenyltetrahydrofolate cyclohydrolase FolD [Acidobacteriota bacterium]